MIGFTGGILIWQTYLNKLVGLLIVMIIDGVHFLQKFFFTKSAAGTQCLQGIVVIPKLGVHVAQ